MKRALTLMLCGAAYGAGMSAGAQTTLLSNLPFPQASNYGYLMEVNCCRGAALGFKIPADLGFILDSVTLTLLPDMPSGPFNPRIELRTNMPENQPSDTVLLTFPTAGLSAQPVETRYTLRPESTFVFRPETTYWLVMPMISEADSGFEWVGEVAANAAEPKPPGGIATLVGYRFTSSRLGGSWWPEASSPAVAITGTPLPVLMAIPTAQGVTLRWSALATNFALESTSDLTDGWMEVAQTPAIVNGQFSITLSAEGPGRFFRLRQEQ